MKKSDHSLKVLLYARTTGNERIHAVITELKKVYHSFHRIQIYLCSNQQVMFEDGAMVEQVRSDSEGALFGEKGLRQVDLVMLDDITPQDLHHILALMMRQVPVIVEWRLTEQCQNIFIPGKTVESYSHASLGSLPFIVLKFLRNLRWKNRILGEAQRVASHQKKEIKAEGVLWIPDAMIMTDPGSEPDPRNPSDEGKLMLEVQEQWQKQHESLEELQHPMESDRISQEEFAIPPYGRDDEMEIPISAESLPGPHGQKDGVQEKLEPGGVIPGKLNKGIFWEKWGKKKEGGLPKLPVESHRFEKMVDLVVISYNTLTYLRQCIQSIRENTLYPYRLIVVDNGSRDGSVEYLRQQPNLYLIENSQNVGYAKACNQGILAGRSEYVVILNTDVKVTRGWLTSMVQFANMDRQIGVIGPKMINEKSQIVGAGVTRLGPVCSSRGWMQQNRNGLYDKVEDCYSVGGACYMVRREALEKVGGFDESYFFYYEETDLSFRMIEKGYRVVYYPDVTVLHYHEGSLDKENYLERVKRNNYFSVSQERFMKKWHEVIHDAPARPVVKEIVVFGLIPWSFRYQRPQQICSRLAEYGYRVFYVNNMCQRGGRVEKITPRIYAFYPDGEGIVYRQLATEEGRGRVVHSINQILEKMHFSHPILWVDAPYWEKAVQCFDRQFVVYNCMDSYADFADIREFCPQIQQMEENVCHAAELILTSSKHLQQRLSRYGKLAHLIPNGVDRKHFNLERDLPTPADLRNIPGPIIGYYGAIAEWFDFDLITYAAEQLPQYSFVLIGDCTVDVGRLRALPNVYFLGEKSYQELPGYVKHFEIAVIPFRRNELTLSTNPVKLYEYLATGKPIVSVDLPEIKPYANVVYIARDYDEFVYFLEEVVGREAWWVQEKRKKAVRDHDWNDRVQEVAQFLEYYQGAIAQKSLFSTLGLKGKEGVE